MVQTVISIIIPIYKIKETYLRMCLDSIKSQSYPDWRAILIDDGSPDNCGLICDEYSEMDERFFVIHKKNAGVAAARNSGLEKVNTEWVTFIDPDDWVDDKMVETIIQTIEEVSDADVIMWDYWREYAEQSREERYGTENGWVEGNELHAIKRAPFYKLIRNGKVNPYAVPALWIKAYRYSFLQENQIRFLPEAKKGQDRLFNARVLLNTDKIYYLHKTMYHYRCTESSVTNRYNPEIVKLTQIENEELWRLLKEYRHYSDFEELFYCRICTRLYSCMRLYYFNAKNSASFSGMVKEIDQLLAKEPFYEAIKKAKYRYFNLQEKIFVFLLRYRAYRACRFLVHLRAEKFRKQLS